MKIAKNSQKKLNFAKILFQYLFQVGPSQAQYLWKQLSLTPCQSSRQILQTCQWLPTLGDFESRTNNQAQWTRITNTLQQNFFNDIIFKTLCVLCTVWTGWFKKSQIPDQTNYRISSYKTRRYYFFGVPSTAGIIRMPVLLEG